MSNIKLFCLPYAGGSVSTYMTWQERIRSYVDVIPIEYPGRGRKAKEVLCTTIETLVDSVYNDITDILNPDDKYIIYGHSMGSLVAYKLIHKLVKNGFSMPYHIIFSGGKAPQKRTKKKENYKLPDDQFEVVLNQYGGNLINELFHNNDLKEFFVPILRSDFQIVEEYIYEKEDCILDCSISVFAGQDDESTTWEDIKDWSRITKGKCEYYYFDGGHFFINNCQEEVLKKVNYIIDLLAS